MDAARDCADRAQAPITFIVPVLNEARRIQQTLERLTPAVERGAEVIVVDGGSEDGTERRVQALGLSCVRARRGRAHQMNAGARAARGRWLAFLHADTVAAPPVLHRLMHIAVTETPGWGRFDVRIDDDATLFRIIEFSMNLRSRLTSVTTGDQLMFVHRELFERVKGFPPIALMEDVALSTSLRRHCAPLCCREQVVTSARRWQRGGPLRTMALMWWLRARYALGADPEVLARAYRASETDR